MYGSVLETGIYMVDIKTKWFMYIHIAAYIHNKYAVCSKMPKINTRFEAARFGPVLRDSDPSAKKRS